MPFIVYQNRGKQRKTKHLFYATPRQRHFEIIDTKLVENSLSICALTKFARFISGLDFSIIPFDNCNKLKIDFALPWYIYVRYRKQSGVNNQSTCCIKQMHGSTLFWPKVKLQPKILFARTAVHVKWLTKWQFTWWQHGHLQNIFFGTKTSTHCVDNSHWHSSTDNINLFFSSTSKTWKTIPKSDVQTWANFVLNAMQISLPTNECR